MNRPEMNWEAIKADVSAAIDSLKEVDSSLDECTGNQMGLWTSLIEGSVDELIELCSYAHINSVPELKARWFKSYPALYKDKTGLWRKS